MGILIILLVLVLGYHYTENNLIEKIRLRRSNGWESYVHLGKFGLKFVVTGALVSALLWLLLGLIDLLLYGVGLGLGWEIAFQLRTILEFAVLDISVFWISTFVFGFLFAKLEAEKLETDKEETDKKQDQYAELVRYDGFFAVAVKAMVTQGLVKISLKSRKVYIGLVDSEQFEQIDFDHLLVIPFQSGHRDKDSLKLKIDCDYLNVYRLHGIDFENGSNLSELKKFRCAIRTSEIESISLFDTEYFKDFDEANRKNTEN